LNKYPRWQPIYSQNGKFFNDGRGQILMREFIDIVDRMKPDEVMETVTTVVKRVFPYISEKARLDFLAAFTGEADPDSLPGLVHL
jgi:CO dehydrogenase/acetyl-CoA synthase gamma subunit (corrinoid Fe-S protein)